MTTGDGSVTNSDDAPMLAMPTPISPCRTPRPCENTKAEVAPINPKTARSHRSSSSRVVSTVVDAINHENPYRVHARPRPRSSRSTTDRRSPSTDRSIDRSTALARVRVERARARRIARPEARSRPT